MVVKLPGRDDMAWMSFDGPPPSKPADAFFGSSGSASDSLLFGDGRRTYQDEEQRKRSETFLNTEAPGLYERAHTRFLEAKESVSAADIAGFADRLDKEFDKDVAEVAKRAPDASTKDDFRQGAVELRNSLHASATAFETVKMVEFKQAELNQKANSIIGLARRSPEGFAHHQAMVKGLLNATGDALEPGKLAEAERNLQGGLAEASVEGFLDRGDADGAEGFLDDLIQSGDDAVNGAPALDAGTFERLGGSIARARGAASARLGAQTRAAVLEAKSAAAAVVGDMEAGYLPAGLDELSEQLKSASNISGESSETKELAEIARQVETAARAQDYQGGFVLLPPKEQSQAIQQLKTRGKKSADQAGVVEVLEKIAANAKQKLETDPYEHGIKAGLVDEPEPLDVGNPESLEIRIRSAEEVSAHYGAPAIPLTAAEAAEVARTYRESDSAGRFTIIKGLIDAKMPDEMLDGTIEALKSRDPGLGAIATIAKSDMARAQSIVNGQQFAAANSGASPKVADTAEILDVSMGNLPPAERAAVKSAADGLYVHSRMGESMDEFDPNAYRAALDSVKEGIGAENFAGGTGDNELADDDEADDGDTANDATPDEVGDEADSLEPEVTVGEDPFESPSIHIS